MFSDIACVTAIDLSPAALESGNCRDTSSLVGEGGRARHQNNDLLIE